MSDGTRLGRRGFLGTGLVAVAGLGLGATLGSCGRGGALSWRADEAEGAFPDREVHLDLRLPAGVEASAAGVALTVRTPREVLRFELPAPEVSGGRASFPVRLVYPYDDYVAGDYEYVAEVVAGGTRLTTERPVVYRVRPMAWFS